MKQDVNLGSDGHVRIRQELEREIGYEKGGVVSGFFCFLASGRTAGVIAGILAVVAGGGFTAYASQDACPGDLLYPTRVATEKIRMAMTFDERGKKDLSIRFASRHARDIAKMFSSDGDYKDRNTEELEKSFEQNIKSAKIELDDTKLVDNSDVVGNDGKEEQGDGVKNENKYYQEDKNKTGQKDEDRDASKEDGGKIASTLDQEQNKNKDQNQDQNQDQNTEKDDRFYSVDAGRDGNNVEIYDPKEEDDSDLSLSSTTKESSTTQEDILSLDKDIENTESDLDVLDNKELIGLLEEAEDLFEAGKYSESEEKLNEFVLLMDQDNNTGATSSPEKEASSTKSSVTEESSTSTATSLDTE